MKYRPISSGASYLEKKKEIRSRQDWCRWKVLEDEGKYRNHLPELFTRYEPICSVMSYMAINKKKSDLVKSGMVENVLRI